MASRKLTDEEKERVHAWAMAKAQADHPEARVTVVVSDRADVDGRVHYTLLTTSSGTVTLEDVAS